MEDLKQIRAAGCGAIHLSTRDEEEAIKEIVLSLKGPKYLYTSAGGLCEIFKNKKKDLNDSIKEIEPVEFLPNLDHTLETLKENAIIILVDVFTFIEEDPIIRRALIEAANEAKKRGWFIILLDSQTKPHKDISERFSTLVFPLPNYPKTRDKLENLLNDEELTVPDTDRAVSHLLGLAAHQQTDAISLAIVEALKQEKEEINPDTLRHYKEREIDKTNYLKISEPTKRFDNLIGHKGLKRFLKERYHGFSAEAREFGLAVPRGMLLIGPPGTGKSRFGEATAGEWGIPFLRLDFSAIFGSYLGESEERLNNAIELAEKCSPCVLLVDEIERAFGKAGEKDGGTSERVTGKMLNWMADKTSPVFVIFTANNADRLPAALIRKGRLDEIFSLDFPQVEERHQIWDYYLQNANHQLNKTQILELADATNGFSPAEIEAMVESVKFKSFSTKNKISLADLKEELGKTTPISQAMKNQIDTMRYWSNTHARSTH